MESTTILNRLRWFRLLLILFIASASYCAIARQPGDADSAAKARIRQVLLRSLQPSDLDLSQKQLKEKLLLIAANSKAFDQVVEDGKLVKVRGTVRQWIFLACNTSESLDLTVPYKGFWIGAVQKRISITALPDDVNDLTGPIDGEWRRHGTYVIGAGVNLATHSPTWADGEILVYKVGKDGLVPVNSQKIAAVESICFLSKTSDEIVSQDTEELCSVIDTHKTGATEKRKWQFEKGRYKQVSRKPLFPEVLAFDRLLQSVENRDSKTFREMVPQTSYRAWLWKDSLRCLKADIVRIDFIEGTDRLGLTKWSNPDLESHFTITFRQTRLGWVVSKIEKR